VPLGVVTTLALTAGVGLGVSRVSWLPLVAVAGLIAFVALVAIGEFRGLLAWFALSPWLQPFASDYLGIGTPVSFDRIFFPAVFAAFLVRRLLARRALTIDWVTGWMAAFVAYYGVTLLYASDPYKDGVALLQHYFLAFLTYVVVAGTVKTRKRLFAVLDVALVNTVGLSLVGFQEHFTGVSIFTGDLAFVGIYLGRAAGPFSNPAVYGPVLCMLVFLTSITARHSPDWRRVVASAVGMLLTTFALFFTYTRSAWVSLAVGLLTLMIFDRRLRWPLAAGFVGLAIVAAALYPVIQADSELYTRIADPANGIGRLDNAALQWQAFWHSPLIGNGPGVFNANNNIRAGWVSHNAFLTVLVDNGLYGLILFVATLAAAAGRTVLAFRACAPRSLEREAIVACWAGLAAYLSTTMFIDDVYFVFPTAFFWTLFALPIGIRPVGGTA
jgi:O-antigen ligase